MGGPMGPRLGKGLLGQGPLSLLGNAPKSLMSIPVAVPASLLPSNQPAAQSALPPGYLEGGFDEEQVKTFLKAQREALQVLVLKCERAVTFGLAFFKLYISAIVSLLVNNKLELTCK